MIVLLLFLQKQNLYTHTQTHTHTHTQYFIVINNFCIHTHTLSASSECCIRRLRLFHVHYCNICCFLILLPSAAARACIVVPGSWSSRYGVLVSAAPTCIGVPILRLQSYHHHICHSSFVLVCPYWDYNHITINIHHTIIPLSYTSVIFRLSGFGFRVDNVEVSA